MKPILTVYKDQEYNAIENFLDLRKKYLDIREWVTMQDLYVNEFGDVFYVELYDTEYSREEGHGQHDVIGHQEPMQYHLLLNAGGVKREVELHEELDDDKEPSKLVWAVMFLALGLLGWILLYAGQGMVNN